MKSILIIIAVTMVLLFGCVGQKPQANKTDQARQTNATIANASNGTLSMTSQQTEEVVRALENELQNLTINDSQLEDLLNNLSK